MSSFLCLVLITEYRANGDLLEIGSLSSIIHTPSIAPDPLLHKTQRNHRMQWCLAANRHTGSLEQRRERREEGTAHPHYQRTTKPSSLELAGPVTRPRVRAPTEGGRGSGQLAGGSGSAEGRRELARGAGRPWRRRQWRERRPNPSGGNGGSAARSGLGSLGVGTGSGSAEGRRELARGAGRPWRRRRRQWIERRQWRERGNRESRSRDGRTGTECVALAAGSSLEF